MTKILLWLSVISFCIACNHTTKQANTDDLPDQGGEPIAGVMGSGGDEGGGITAGKMNIGGAEIAGSEPEGGLWLDPMEPTEPAELTEGPRGILYPAGVDMIELTGVMINNGQSEELEIDLPEDVLSVTMIALADETHMVSIVDFIDPFGEVLVSENPPGVTLTQFDQFLSPFPGPFKSPNRVAVASTGVGTLLAPNNPNVALRGGNWGYRLKAINATTGSPATINIDLLIFIKRGVEPTRSQLDVHLHFTGARGWTAANAPEDPDFQSALNRMREFYEEVGIELGEITYDDIPASFRTADAGQMPNSVLHQIYAQNQYSTGVALFFVERINSQFGAGMIGGIAGGTPGPSLIPSTPRSGVVVATEIDPDPRAIGHIMGHESGHFLGLFHTTELAIPGVNDQIPDTPEGQASNTNLMFPTVTAGDAHLTEGQGWVMHRNANVFPITQ